MNINFNTFHSDGWTCSFSNMPSMSGVADMAMFDNFVKSLVLPDYNIEEIDSQFMGFRVRHPVAPKLNTNLSQLQIEFKLNEDALNYLTLFEFMRQLKYAELSDNFTEDWIRKYTIKSIILNLNDNQKRLIAVIRFTEAFLLSLSSLSLTTGSAEEITFTCNFSYEEILYERKSIYYS
ncbi:MAG: hypothetical protein QXG00_07035 [Candidatus Woesearchaeota archaeon]